MGDGYGFVVYFDYNFFPTKWHETTSRIQIERHVYETSDRINIKRCDGIFVYDTVIPFSILEWDIKEKEQKIFAIIPRLKRIGLPASGF